MGRKSSSFDVDARLAYLRAHPTEQIRKQFSIAHDDKAVNEQARSIRLTITTGAVDRDNDRIEPTGWDLRNFLKSPVVLWAHDYSQLPVARATELTANGYALESVAQFPPQGVHPFADTVFDLLKGGFLNAASVGFRPIEYERDAEREGINFRKQELLEFSIVPVPANPEALVIARSQGIDVNPLETWAKAILMAVGKESVRDERLRMVERFSQTAAPETLAKGVSPKDVSLSKAPEETPWSAPSLGDLLGDTSWDDATDAQKRKVAGHFAWAAEMPPETFGDCKLPHHRADGAIVFRGVVAATGRLNQASIPSADMSAVKEHLRRHYKAFGKSDDEIPDTLKDVGYYSEKHSTLIAAMRDVLTVQLQRVDADRGVLHDNQCIA